MAKTYPWSDIVPAGSEQASTADDHIRRLRLEIHERMNDIVEDWSADPIVLQPGLIGPKADKKRLIHHHAFTVEPSEANTFQYTVTGLTISQAANPARAAVEFAAECILTRIRWLVTNNDTAPLTVSFGFVEFAIGVASGTICSMTSTTSGVHIIDSEVLSPMAHTVSDDQMLYLSIDKGSGAPFTLHGVEITYDTPDARSTL